jgi:hypothetical protein
LYCKIPEFFEKPPFSGVGKHPDFQVTSFLQNVTKDGKFDDLWKLQTLNTCRKTDIFGNFSFFSDEVS